MNPATAPTRGAPTRGTPTPSGLTGWLLDIYPAPEVAPTQGARSRGAPAQDTPSCSDGVNFDGVDFDGVDSSEDNSSVAKISDVSPSPSILTPQPGVIAWVLGDDGERHRLALPFPVTFYAAGPAPRLRELWHHLRRGAPRSGTMPVQLKREERRELFSEKPTTVLAIRVETPAVQSSLFYHVSHAFPDLTYFDADISIPLHAAARWGIFPLSRCRLMPDLSLQALDTPWELESPVPPLRILKIMPDTDPHHTPPHSLEIRASVRGFLHQGSSQVDREGSLEPPLELSKASYHLPLEPERPLLVNLAAILKRHDPDLLLTTWGDGWLLPRLLESAEKLGITLPLNRDPACEVAHRKELSYFSYGQVIYRDRQVHLFGRWHIDCSNAMLWDDYTLEGVLESARVTGLPVQTSARTSPGTGISSMQIVTALRWQVLVPWRKSEPERFKRASDLFAADQGGLVYQPLTGLHANVGGIDFVSMYPGIMVRFNISPETAGNVPHKADQLEPIPDPGAIPVNSGAIPVNPGAIPGHNPSSIPTSHVEILDQDRPGAGCTDTGDGSDISVPLKAGSFPEGKGLVPQTLSPLLQKRLELKNFLATMPKWDPRRELYKARASAHKWLLVTCFGYLGYRNARFGRIEAHEAVTAYGREALIRAKEAAEDLGFTVLHMYVDGLWVIQDGAVTVSDFQPLLDEIIQRTGLPISLDGIYRWVAFLPSRVNERVPVANRYFGVFQDGSLKVRGIEARRHDTPAFIAKTQMEMLEILARAPDAKSLPDYLPQAYAHLQHRLRQLRQGKVPLESLLVSLKLSRELDQYRVPSPAARAARQLADMGKEMRPGQRVRFLYLRGEPDVHAWDCPGLPDPRRIDIDMYEKLMGRAAETVLVPLGGEKLLYPERQLHFRSVKR